MFYVITVHLSVVEEIMEEKKLMIRAKLTRYAKRAEELKCMLTIDSANREVTKFPKFAEILKPNTNAPAQTDHSEVDSVVNQKKSYSTSQHKELKQLCKHSFVLE